MENLIWVTTQPDHKEFIWETMVQELNFIENGIDPNDVYCLFAVRDTPSSDLLYLQKHSKLNVQIYPDYRAEPLTYTPAVQPHLLKQFYDRHRDINYVMHLDSDVIMQKLPSLTGMMDGDWHISDANSYLGIGYLRNFPAFLIGIEKIFGITEKWLEENERKCGGAGGPNYLMCNIDSSFFEEVEEMANTIYSMFSDTTEGTPSVPKNKYDGKDIQIWTAGMWAWQWSAWKRNIITTVDTELAFCMSDHLTDQYSQNFFHNTGAAKELGLFNKRDYFYSYPFEIYHEAKLMYAQHTYMRYLNAIKKDLDISISVIVQGDNPVVYPLPAQILVIGYSPLTECCSQDTFNESLLRGWWVIEGTECPDEKEFQHLLDIKDYNTTVQWSTWTIKRKLL